MPSHYASKARMMSALIPGEQRPAVLLNGELLEDVYKFKYRSSIFIANSPGTEEVRSKINFDHVLDRGVKYRCVKRPGSTRQ